MRIHSSICPVFLIFILATSTNSEIQAADTTLIDVITLPYNIKTIASDSAGVVWLSGARGLQYYDFEKKTFVTTDPSFKSEIFADQGRITMYIRDKQMLFFPWDKYEVWLSQLPPGYYNVSVAKDKFGHYWVSTGSQLFIFSVEQRFTQILSNYSTRGICKDGDDLYVNTYSGILRNGQAVFKRFSFGEGEIKKFGESLYIAWGGLIRYQPLTQTSEFIKTTMSPLSVQNLHQIHDTIWVGTNFGLGYIDNDSLVMISNFPNIEDLICFEDGLLIAGRNLTKPRKIPIPYHNLPKPDCKDCRGIYVMQNNQLRKLELPELNYSQIIEADERYYFASDSGVVVWDGAGDISVITEVNGLTDNRTCTMALDDHGFLWVSTFSGLNRINLSTGKINRYLSNIEFNYRSVMQNDSMIYMGGIEGIYTFRPNDFLGDDIEPATPLKTRQILFLVGIGIALLGSVFFYSIKWYYRKRLQIKEMEKMKADRQVFLMQIEQVFFQKDMSLTVKTLAEAMDISERSLYRSFQQHDLTPGMCLKELRLKKAKYLLQGSTDIDTIKKVAQNVGYTEQYLRRMLKKTIP